RNPRSGSWGGGGRYPAGRDGRRRSAILGGGDQPARGGSMILTIDSGNTRTKWVIFDQANAIVTHGVIDNSQLDTAPPEWSDCALAVISNVAGDAIASRLQGMLAGTLRQYWLTASAEAFGIVNAYEHPHR